MEAVRLHSAMGIRVGLTLASLTLLGGCQGPRTTGVADLAAGGRVVGTSPVVAAAVRDLTVPAPATAGAQFTTAMELVRIKSYRHSIRARRHQPKSRSTPQPVASVQENIPPPAPVAQKEPASRDSVAAPAASSAQTRVLDPGETVTVLPAIAAAGTSEPAEQAPSRVRQAGVFIGRGGGTCHPGRGGNPGFR